MADWSTVNDPYAPADMTHPPAPDISVIGIVEPEPQPNSAQQDDSMYPQKAE